MASTRFVAQHGMSSQTGAVQHLIRTAVGAAVTGAVGRRRKKKMSARMPGQRRRGTARRQASSRASAARVRPSALSRRRNGRRAGKNRVPSRLVKGSLAAKRYMAKIRRMRK